MQYDSFVPYTGRVFKLGQPLRVRVADASKEERTVDFELAYEE